MMIKHGLKKSKQSGFSLVELMVVIAVIAIMATFAVPGFLTWRTNFHLKKAARDLLGHMQRAKLTAVKERTDCAVSFGVAIDGTNYDYIVFVDSDNDRTYDAGETIIKQVQWDEDVDFDTSTEASGTNFPSDTVVFNSRGRSNNLGRAYLKNDNERKIEVIVSMAGNIRIKAI